MRSFRFSDFESPVFVHNIWRRVWGFQPSVGIWILGSVICLPHQGLTWSAEQRRHLLHICTSALHVSAAPEEQGLGICKMKAEDRESELSEFENLSTLWWQSLPSPSLSDSFTISFLFQELLRSFPNIPLFQVLYFIYLKKIFFFLFWPPWSVWSS